jgi:hypothetical protein
MTQVHGAGSEDSGLPRGQLSYDRQEGFPVKHTENDILALSLESGEEFDICLI